MIELSAEVCQDYEQARRHEWLLASGSGGYATGTVSGAMTRRQHGLWVPATKGFGERMVIWAAADVWASVGGEDFGLSTQQYRDVAYPQGHQHLIEFSADRDRIQWTFDLDGQMLAQQLVLTRRGAELSWQAKGDAAVRLNVKPLVCHKPHGGTFRDSESYPEGLELRAESTRIIHDGLPAEFLHEGWDRTAVVGWNYRFSLVEDDARGLDPTMDLFCPCELLTLVQPGETAALECQAGLPPEAAESRYLVKSPKESAIIEGYPWHSISSRGAMVSLPGLLLAPGAFDEARQVLASAVRRLKGGLLPKSLGGKQSDYATCDSALWFIHALEECLRADWQDGFAAEAAGWIEDVLVAHLEGTLFGIGADPDDGLLCQGEPGVQLTWMDVAADGWTVSPRHGKPIEVNGLWINALRAAAWLWSRLGRDGLRWRLAAEKAESNFTEVFWRRSIGYYLDTAAPDDGSLRPNQVIALGMRHTPARTEHAISALDKVDKHLLTARGLRTLSPQAAGYKDRFEGTAKDRDLARHQGAAWPWLLGSYVSAVLRFTGDIERAEKALAAEDEMRHQYGLDGIAEVYDGDDPQRPGGCPWQAWSEAEFARARHLISQAKNGRLPGLDSEA